MFYSRTTKLLTDVISHRKKHNFALELSQKVVGKECDIFSLSDCAIICWLQHLIGYQNVLIVFVHVSFPSDKTPELFYQMYSPNDSIIDNMIYIAYS